MNIDGFSPGGSDAFASFDPVEADRLFRWVDRIALRLGIEVHGLEHVPDGPAILVVNHAFGWDVVFLMAAIWRSRRRPAWALGEHLWWRVPFLRRVAAAMGTVDGTPENLDRLLARGELVVVLPGGLREAVKPRELRYRLLWGARYGFVRAAIRSGAPLIPVASIGTDELFDFVGNAYRRGARWLGHGLPLPLPSRILPIPHLTRVTFLVGEPVSVVSAAGAGDDPATLRRIRHEVAGALHELIDTELAQRAGVSLGDRFVNEGHTS